MTRKRAALAGLLSLVYPGLGHVYLREWIRAVGWLGIALATAALVVPETTLQMVDSVELGALLDVGRSLPREAILTILFVRGLTVFDAALLGLRSGRRDGSDAPTCPDCGGELDREIDFCPWCTRRLQYDADAS